MLFNDVNEKGGVLTFEIYDYMDSLNNSQVNLLIDAYSDLTFAVHSDTFEMLMYLLQHVSSDRYIELYHRFYNI